MNYKGGCHLLDSELLLQTFFINQLHLFGGENGLADGIQSLLGLLVHKVDFEFAQDEEGHSKCNIYANLCW